MRVDHCADCGLFLATHIASCCATGTGFLAGEVQLVFKVDMVLSTARGSLRLLADKGSALKKEEVWMVVNCLADPLHITCCRLTGMWMALSAL